MDNENNISVLIKKVDRDYLEKNFDILLKKLYPMRKEAVERFNNKEAAYISMTAGFVLMEAYDRTYGGKSSDIIIKKGENGKPFVEGHEDFKFNISHSGDYVVIAFTVSEDINSLGIDIEKIRNRDDDMRVANRFFSKSEIDYISDGLECSDIDMRFYKVWTMKEAYIKMTGKGLSQRLDSFSVNPDEFSVAFEEKTIDASESDSIKEDHKDYVKGTVCFDSKVFDGYTLTVCMSCSDKKILNYEEI